MKSAIEVGIKQLIKKCRRAGIQPKHVTVNPTRLKRRKFVCGLEVIHDSSCPPDQFYITSTRIRHKIIKEAENK